MDHLPSPVVFSGFASELHPAHPIPHPNPTPDSLAAALLARSPNTAPAIVDAACRAALSVATAAAAGTVVVAGCGSNDGISQPSSRATAFTIDAEILNSADAAQLMATTSTAAAALAVVDPDAMLLVPRTVMGRLGVMSGGWLSIGSSSSGGGGGGRGDGDDDCCGRASAQQPHSTAQNPRYVQVYPCPSPPPSPSSHAGDKTKTAAGDGGGSLSTPGALERQTQHTAVPAAWLARAAFSQVCAAYFTIESIARSSRIGNNLFQPSPPPSLPSAISHAQQHGRVAVARLVLSRPPHGCTEAPPAARAVTVTRVLAPRHDRSVDWTEYVAIIFLPFLLFFGSHFKMNFSPKFNTRAQTRVHRTVLFQLDVFRHSCSGRNTSGCNTSRARGLRNCLTPPPKFMLCMLFW